MARKYAKKTRNNRRLNWLWIVLGAAAVIMVGAIILTSILANPAQTANAPAPVEITVEQAFTKYQQGALILDVRSQEEWDQSHIQGSILIPLEELENRLAELPRDREMVVVCRSGYRSASAATLLMQNGFTLISSMSGGLNAWQEADFPLEGGTQ